MATTGSARQGFTVRRISDTLGEMDPHLLSTADDFLVAEKPAGLLCVPGRGPEKRDSLLSRLQARFPDVLLVHRLDMDTSGIVLFARTPPAQRELSRQFAERTTEKIYEAVVEGIPETDAGSVEFPLRKDLAQRLPPKHLVDCVRGKPALTRWRVLERFAGGARLELRPETGRSHQLRVHLAAIGHPIAGDPIYGTPGKRLMLHARALAFRHPRTAETIRVESPVPF